MSNSPREIYTKNGELNHSIYITQVTSWVIFVYFLSYLIVNTSNFIQNIFIDCPTCFGIFGGGLITPIIILPLGGLWIFGMMKSISIISYWIEDYISITKKNKRVLLISIFVGILSSIIFYFYGYASYFVVLAIIFLLTSLSGLLGILLKDNKVTNSKERIIYLILSILSICGSIFLLSKGLIVIGMFFLIFPTLTILYSFYVNFRNIESLPKLILSYIILGLFIFLIEGFVLLISGVV